MRMHTPVVPKPLHSSLVDGLESPDAVSRMLFSSYITMSTIVGYQMGQRRIGWRLVHTALPVLYILACH